MYCPYANIGGDSESGSLGCTKHPGSLSVHRPQQPDDEVAVNDREIVGNSARNTKYSCRQDDLVSQAKFRVRIGVECGVRCRRGFEVECELELGTRSDVLTAS